MYVHYGEVRNLTVV